MRKTIFIAALLFSTVLSAIEKVQFPESFVNGWEPYVGKMVHADDHDAFQTDVDDTGTFSETAAQCNKHQHRSEDQSILQQKDH